MRLHSGLCKTGMLQERSPLLGLSSCWRKDNSSSPAASRRRMEGCTRVIPFRELLNGTPVQPPVQAVVLVTVQRPCLGDCERTAHLHPIDVGATCRSEPWSALQRGGEGA